MRCLSLKALFAVTNKLRITKSRSGVYESEILLKYPLCTFHPYYFHKTVIVRIPRDFESSACLHRGQAK